MSLMLLDALNETLLFGRTTALLVAMIEEICTIPVEPRDACQHCLITPRLFQAHVVVLPGQE